MKCKNPNCQVHGVESGDPITTIAAGYGSHLRQATLRGMTARYDRAWNACYQRGGELLAAWDELLAADPAARAETGEGHPPRSVVIHAFGSAVEIPLRPGEWALPDVIRKLTLGQGSSRNA